MFYSYRLCQFAIVSFVFKSCEKFENAVILMTAGVWVLPVCDADLEDHVRKDLKNAVEAKLGCKK